MLIYTFEITFTILFSLEDVNASPFSEKPILIVFLVYFTKWDSKILMAIYFGG